MDSNSFDRRDGDNGWHEYQKLVLNELKRLDHGITCVQDKVDRLHDQVLMLKFRSGVWGLVAGAVPGLIAAIYIILEVK